MSAWVLGRNVSMRVKLPQGNRIRENQACSDQVTLYRLETHTGVGRLQQGVADSEGTSHSTQSFYFFYQRWSERIQSLTLYLSPATSIYWGKYCSGEALPLSFKVEDRAIG